MMKKFVRYTVSVCLCGTALVGCVTAARVREAKKTELVRVVEVAKMAEAVRLAEETRKAEELRKAEEVRIAEETRKAEEVRKAEEAKIAAEKAAAEEAAAKALALRMERTKHVYDVGYRIAKSVPLDPVKNERFCGFLVAPLDATVAKVYGLTAAPESVVVFGVIPGSAVDKAGIAEKDIIVTVDGHPVTIGNFDSTVTALIAGQAYPIVVNRGGVEQTLSLTPEVIRMYVPFTVLETPDASVFASPDGVNVTYGFLDYVKNDDELAVALSHELAHLVRGKILKDSGIGLFSRILAVVIAQAKTPAAEPAAPEVVAATAPVVPAAADAVSVTPAAASNDLEPEADLFGIVYAYKAGYDTEAGLQVWERFSTVFPTQLTTSYIGATHPISAERLARIKEIIAKLKAGTFVEGEYLTKKAS